MIFQDPAASLNERATIEYCISEGLYNFHLYKDEEERIAKVDQALGRSSARCPSTSPVIRTGFSARQRQRVGIARAMIMDPKLIVADEPISALDVSIRAQVLNLMNKLKAEKNLTYLFIAHDLSVVRFIADRIAVIHLGEIVEIADSGDSVPVPAASVHHLPAPAVPMPDPVVERTPPRHRVRPLQAGPVRRAALPARDPPLHFVFATDKEMEGYEKKLAEIENAKNQ